MKQEWDNFRTIWNKEAKAIGHKQLAEIVTPADREKPFNHSYVGKLGKGIYNKFTEQILEKFSEHMNLPLSEMFMNNNISVAEKETMIKLNEMIEAMKTNQELKCALYVEYLKLKNLFANNPIEKNLSSLRAKV